MALYEPDAWLLPQPGVRVQGHGAIREALAGFLALQGDFHMEAPRITEGRDVALLVAAWTLEAKGPDGAPIRLAGRTADVVRRQADGRWLFAIDSPFGAVA